MGYRGQKPSMTTYLILKCENVNTSYQEIPLVYIEYTHMPYAQRLHHHLYHSQLEKPKEQFHRAIQYLGTQAFKWEILDETQDEDEAKELVKYYQHEYKSDVIGYNKQVDADMANENNPRFGDHRTWEELHGKERAEELRQIQIKNFTGNKSLSEHMTRRLQVWNPMDDPAAREKVRQSKLGTKNPQALYDYYFTKEDGTEIKIECLREYCREHPELRRASITAAAKTGKKYKNMFIRKVLKNGKPQRNQGSG